MAGLAGVQRAMSRPTAPAQEPAITGPSGPDVIPTSAPAPQPPNVSKGCGCSTNVRFEEVAAEPAVGLGASTGSATVPKVQDPFPAPELVEGELAERELVKGPQTDHRTLLWAPPRAPPTATSPSGPDANPSQDASAP